MVHGATRRMCMLKLTIMEPIQHLKKHEGGIITFVRRNPMADVLANLPVELSAASSLLLNNFGWGNGYVGLPAKHPAEGKHYDEEVVEVHGGWTYSEEEIIEVDGVYEQFWVFGFDTGHYNDGRWTEEMVVEEIESTVPYWQTYIKSLS
jgi:hypothetical protein